MKTITVDDYQRVRLPDAEPRSKFSYEVDANGVIRLTKLIPAGEKPIHSRLVKKNGRLVITTDRPPDMQAIKDLLAEFP